MPNAADSAMQFGLSQVGKHYCMGGVGPNCYDCSGFVQTCYKVGGVPLPRTTFEQVTVGMDVAQSDLAPGDLVFPDPGHVQIYIGGGNQVEAANVSTGVVSRGMWGFWKARRVTTPGGVAALAGLNAASSGNAGCSALGVGLVSLSLLTYRTGRMVASHSEQSGERWSP